MSRQSDDLLPVTIPSHLGRIVGAAVAVLLAGMIIAGLIGGVEWLAAVGAAGTAVGTLGLAYFTFTVAEGETELVDSSQRLEQSAADELQEGRKQTTAAASMAREAEKSRIDALAPIVDFEVVWDGIYQQPRGITPAPDPISVSLDHVQNADVKRLRFIAKLELKLTNFGRTPAFVRVTDSGAAFTGQNELIRVDPDPDRPRTFVAEVDYATQAESPFDPRAVRYEMDAEGPIIAQTVDRIVWEGEITPLQPAGPGWRIHSSPFRVISYRVNRTHGPEP